jgi:hypothetical protein
MESQESSKEACFIKVVIIFKSRMSFGGAAA